VQSVNNRDEMNMNRPYDGNGEYTSFIDDGGSGGGGS